MGGRSWKINKQQSYIIRVDSNTTKQPTNGIYLSSNQGAPNIYTKNVVQKKLVLL